MKWNIVNLGNFPPKWEDVMAIGQIIYRPGEEDESESQTIVTTVRFYPCRGWETVESGNRFNAVYWAKLPIEEKDGKFILKDR